MKKMLFAGLWALLLLSGLTGAAYAQELMVGGQAVGIQISTDGVFVAGFCPVAHGVGRVEALGDGAGDAEVDGTFLPVHVLRGVERGLAAKAFLALHAGDGSAFPPAAPPRSGGGREVRRVLQTKEGFPRRNGAAEIF